MVEGSAAFLATNLDDLLILMMFFSRVNSTFRVCHVVIGSCWGFALLVVLSLLGFLAGLVIEPAWIGLLGVVPIGLGIQQLWQQIIEPSQIPLEPSPPPFLPVTGRFLHPQAYSVAAVVFANGGDNIGVYIPLFASTSVMGLTIILVLFVLMKGLWCYLAYWLMQRRQIATAFTRYGHRIMPFFLMGLGGFILWKNGSWSLLLGIR